MPNNKFWNFKSSADKKSGELLIYGEISGSNWLGDTVNPTQFKKDMDALGDISELNIYINSPGGDVFAGQAIYSILKRKKCAINVYVDGLAASAASLIAMVGKAQGNTLHMPKNAMLMIHNAWTICVGYASDMRKTADMLDKTSSLCVSIYAEASGLSETDIMELLDAETWMTAQDALDYGFISEIDEAKDIAASINGKIFNINGQKFDMSMFKNFPIDKISKVINGVAPEDVSKNKAPEDEQWSKPNLSDFTDKSWGDLTDTEKKNIAGHFAWAAEMPPATYGDLKFPHHNKNGEAVWNGVANAAARLNQSNIPSEDISKVQAHLGVHYKAFDKVPPWEQDDQSKAENFIVSVVMEAVKTNKGSLGDTLKNLLESKPEKEPTQSSGFFNTQKYADKISQLVERRKKHE